jgi:hypothetical protein
MLWIGLFLLPQDGSRKVELLRTEKLAVLQVMDDALLQNANGVLYGAFVLGLGLVFDERVT